MTAAALALLVLSAPAPPPRPPRGLPEGDYHLAPNRSVATLYADGRVVWADGYGAWRGTWRVELDRLGRRVELFFPNQSAAYAFRPDGNWPSMRRVGPPTSHGP